MDYLAYLGLIATGTRLKRLSETYMAEAQRIYRAADVPFEPKWFALFSLVSERPGLAIGEAAAELGLTHVAVGKLAKELAAEGLFAIEAGVKDRRRSVLSLTEAGNAMRLQLQPLWELMEEACQLVSNRTTSGVLRFLQEHEAALSGHALSDHVLSGLQQGPSPEPVILDYAPRYREDFERLNLEWISRHFQLEDADREALSDPEGTILKGGGAILFARRAGRIVGTCGLKRRDSHTHELVKMAVTDSEQGRGIGRMLLEAAMAKARSLGSDRLYLESNDKLDRALALYRKLGFRDVTPAEPSPYARTNVFMERVL